jgi:hypothetical protein
METVSGGGNVTPAKRLIMIAPSGLIVPPALLANTVAWYDTKYTDRNDITMLQDSSGNNRHMTLSNFDGTGTSGYVSSPIEYLATDGVDDRGRYAENNVVPQHSDVSAVVVFKPVSNAEIFFGQGYATYTFEFYTRGNGASSTFYITDSDISSQTSSIGTAPLDGAKWYIAILTYAQSTKKIKGWLNGQYLGEGSALTNGIRQTNNIRIVGSKENTHTGSHVGNFALGAVFDKALSDNEVKILHNHVCARFGIDAVA